jgi:hypothetical protein
MAGDSSIAQEAAVKYVILIHSNPQSRQIWESFSDAQRAEGLRAYAALGDELMASGEMIVGEALADASMGKRISVTDGRAVASDGPFAESKEQLAGFILIQCDSMERAVEIAGRIPEAPLGLVELRPVMVYSGVEM